ncbi:MAG TPA: class I SAM-dependent methyltransferase [Kiloniellales bacterium]|nr:class I SAM-dependent methyltransferase [Kiloniellales bacterium]
MNDLASLYQNRFDAEELTAKRRLWRVLCRHFFQRYVPRDAVLLDLACGYGEFLHGIDAKEKHGLDLNPDSARHLPPEARFHLGNAEDAPELAGNSFDVVFCSNFLEHLHSKAAVSRVFGEVQRILKPGGRLLLMGPNMRTVPGAYWDFWDHHLPLSERSLAEGLLMAGFELERVIARFLPYSTKSHLPRASILVAGYVRFPPAWLIMGKQFFIVARKAKA